MLSLRETLALVLRRSPSLEGAAAEVRAREAERLQAGRLPNPEASADVEGFAGSGPYSGFDSAETTIELSQLVELGGDRASRVRVASAASRLAGWDYEAQRLEVLTTATKRFIRVLAAQERVDLAQRLLGLATQSQQAAAKRVKAGESSPIDRNRADIQVAQARASLEREGTRLQSARDRLASLWGADEATFRKVKGQFPAHTTVPPRKVLQRYLSENPAVARWADELDARRAARAQAEARAVPDVTVGLGGRHYEETNDNALVATFSMPLPLFDRQRGAIDAARQRIDEAGYSRRHAENRLRAAFARAYGRLRAADRQLNSLTGAILPKAKSVFQAVSTGYREGKFDLLRLLDAQRSLFEARLSAVEARADYLEARTEVEGLIGRSLDSIPTSQGGGAPDR